MTNNQSEMTPRFVTIGYQDAVGRSYYSIIDRKFNRAIAEHIQMHDGDVEKSYVIADIIALLLNELLDVVGNHS